MTSNRTLALVLFASTAACRTTTATEPEVVNPSSTRTATAAAAAAKVSEEWRAKQPSPGPKLDFAVPTLREGKLENGLRVLVYESHALPIVSFQLVARGGSSADAEGKGGVAQLASQMAAEGAGSRDTFAFADAVADLGGSWGARADQDRSAVTISGIARTQAQLVALLADVVLRPRLDAKDFARVQRAALANLERARGTPEGLAFERVPPLIYGPKHPYGHPVGGTRESVAKVGLADVKQYNARAWVPDGAALVAVGDVAFDAVMAMAQQNFGAWKGKSTVPATLAAVAPSARKEIAFVDLPGAPQTLIALGRPTFGRGHPEHHAVEIMNESFGGSFGARLNMNLREAKGYTYGAGSSTSERRGTGAFTVFTKVRADVTAESLHEIFSELERMQIQPPSDEEVSRAKDGQILSIPGQLAQISALAGVGADLFVYGLPLDALSQELVGLRAVTDDGVSEAAKKWLDRSVMQVVLVGDAKTQAAAVEKLGLGKVRVIKP